jgi:hypothetical protein
LETNGKAQLPGGVLDVTKSDVKKSPATKESPRKASGRSKGKAQNEPSLAKTGNLRRGLSRLKASDPSQPSLSLKVSAGARAKVPATVRDKLDRILDELDGEAIVRVLDAAMAARHGMTLAGADRDPRGDLADDPGEAPMRIERSADGDTYHLISGRVWKMLAAEEIAALLRIARHAESEVSAARHLYQWLDRERRDIASDLDITGASSKSLPSMLRLLKETFPVKSPRRLPN